MICKRLHCLVLPAWNTSVTLFKRELAFQLHLLKHAMVQFSPPFLRKAFDERLITQLSRFGQQYADIGALVYRQAMESASLQRLVWCGWALTHQILIWENMGLVSCSFFFYSKIFTGRWWLLSPFFSFVPALGSHRWMKRACKVRSQGMPLKNPSSWSFWVLQLTVDILFAFAISLLAENKFCSVTAADQELMVEIADIMYYYVLYNLTYHILPYFTLVFTCQQAESNELDMYSRDRRDGYDDLHWSPYFSRFWEDVS